MNTLLISKLRRILVCIALLAYGMQSFASGGGLMMSMPIATDTSKSTMPGCHMDAMIVNDGSRVDGNTDHEPFVKAVIKADAITFTCCMGDQCENSCSMTNCSPGTALTSTVFLPWFVIVKPSRHTFDATSFTHYPSSFFRPPIAS